MSAPSLMLCILFVFVTFYGVDYTLKRISSRDYQRQIDDYSIDEFNEYVYQWTQEYWRE